MYATDETTDGEQNAVRSLTYSEKTATLGGVMILIATLSVHFNVMNEWYYMPVFSVGLTLFLVSVGAGFLSRVISRVVD